MKLSDYVADFIANLGPRVYGVCGAGAMHLNDSICNHPRIEFIAMHHEQAAAMAAEAESRITGKIGVVHVTAGPGGTNTITGVAGAWIDSIPMLVIAGQVSSGSLKKRSGLRQLGTNELGLVEIVSSITKYAITVTDPERIRHELELAVYRATVLRPGPVWIEIPLDVQAAQIDPAKLVGLAPNERLSMQVKPYIDRSAANIAEMLYAAEKPLLLVGNGCRQAKDAINQFAATWGIPVCTSWNGSDLFHTDATVGRPGIMGDRAGNFAVQGCDLLLAIGTRLSVPQIGHHADLFAPQAKKIMVDIDHNETNKLPIDVSVICDAGEFLEAMSAHRPHRSYAPWMAQCHAWKEAYPVMLPEYRETKDGVNSYFFMEELAKHLPEDAIVVTDVGAAFISAMQSLRLNGKQRLFHSGGVSAMGWGIPAAIGACLASGRKPTICLVGDGGTMMNLQELQTIVHHNLPISIFVFVNNGYMTMQFTQNTHFKREAASSPTSGVSCPNFFKLAAAFGLFAGAVYATDEVASAFQNYALDPFPTLVVVNMPPGQILAPRVQSRIKDGKFVPAPLDHMWPYLDEETAAA